MNYIPYSMIKSIHEQTHSAMPDAHIRPYVPARHPFRALRRLLQRNTVTEVAPAKLTLVISDGPTDQLCEAEVRDRGTTPAGIARAG
jgi:hypothetical protein